MIIERDIAVELRNLARQYPVVTITGPRQSGKTTLVKIVFPAYDYFSLESPDIRERALADPRGFFNRPAVGFILDEIQKAPALLSYIQEIVDKENIAGKFVLTGSQNLLLMQSVSQSLAGRVALLNLLPLTISELTRLVNRGFTVDEYLWSGFFPRLHERGMEPHRVYDNYYETYIQKDLRDLLQVRDILLFQKFVHLCAGRVGQIFKASELANETGVSVTTIISWLSILQESYIVFLLEPYYANINRRLIKSPKLYFYDVGLASYLLGIENAAQISRDPLRGSLFENMVVAELVKFRCNQGLKPALYFYRDKNMNEVDIVHVAGRQLLPVEIKSAQTFDKGFLKGINYLKKVFPGRIIKPTVIYAGKEEQAGEEFSLLNYENSVKIFLP